MTETRAFPTPVVASLSSGILICPTFSEVHEFAEFLMGHPIWTHQFASKPFMTRVRKLLHEQWPAAPDDIPGVTGSNWEQKAAALVSLHGDLVFIRKGDGTTALAPLDGLPRFTA